MNYLNTVTLLKGHLTLLTFFICFRKSTEPLPSTLANSFSTCHGGDRRNRENPSKQSCPRKYPTASRVVVSVPGSSSGCLSRAGGCLLDVSGTVLGLGLEIKRKGKRSFPLEDSVLL